MTPAGGKITGHGAIGLSGSLIPAGPNTSGALWSVLDAPTVSLMTFYENLQQKPDRSEA